MTEPQQGRPGARGPQFYIGLGFELAVPILVGLFLGYWLDGRFGTTPWLFLVGALLGMLLGLYGFLRRVLPEKRDPGGGAP